MKHVCTCCHVDVHSHAPSCRLAHSSSFSEHPSVLFSHDTFLNMPSIPCPLHALLVQTPPLVSTFPCSNSSCFNLSLFKPHPLFQPTSPCSTSRAGPPAKSMSDGVHPESSMNHGGSPSDLSSLSSRKSGGLSIAMVGTKSLSSILSSQQREVVIEPEMMMMGADGECRVLINGQRSWEPSSDLSSSSTKK